jgi:hypothetical protein
MPNLGNMTRRETLLALGAGGVLPYSSSKRTDDRTSTADISFTENYTVHLHPDESIVAWVKLSIEATDNTEKIEYRIGSDPSESRYDIIESHGFYKKDGLLIWDNSQPAKIKYTTNPVSAGQGSLKAEALGELYGILLPKADSTGESNQDIRFPNDGFADSELPGYSIRFPKITTASREIAGEQVRCVYSKDQHPSVPSDFFEVIQKTIEFASFKNPTPTVGHILDENMGGSEEISGGGFATRPTPDHPIPAFISANNPQIIAHEYAHTQQNFNYTTDMKWLNEGTASYYGGVIGSLYGVEPIAASSISRKLLDARRGIGYSKGKDLCFKIDQKLREITADASFSSVFKRMNASRERIGLTVFKNIVSEVAGASLDSWLDTMITTESPISFDNTDSSGTISHQYERMDLFYPRINYQPGSGLLIVFEHSIPDKELDNLSLSIVSADPSVLSIDGIDKGKITKQTNERLEVNITDSDSMDSVQLTIEMLNRSVGTSMFQITGRAEYADGSIIPVAQRTPTLWVADRELATKPEQPEINSTVLVDSEEIEYSVSTQSSEQTYLWDLTGDGKTNMIGPKARVSLDAANKKDVTATAYETALESSSNSVDVSDTGGLNVALSPSEVVTRDRTSITAVVTNDAGMPVSGATVSISGLDTPGLPETTNTDGEVMVALSSPTPGDYLVSVTADGFNDVAATLTITQSGGDSPVHYANENGVVDTNGLINAINDWRNGDLNTPVLIEMIELWRSGSRVT